MGHGFHGELLVIAMRDFTRSDRDFTRWFQMMSPGKKRELNFPRVSTNEQWTWLCLFKGKKPLITHGTWRYHNPTGDAWGVAGFFQWWRIMTLEINTKHLVPEKLICCLVGAALFWVLAVSKLICLQLDSNVQHIYIFIHVCRVVYTCKTRNLMYHFRRCIYLSNRM